MRIRKSESPMSLPLALPYGVLAAAVALTVAAISGLGFHVFHEFEGALQVGAHARKSERLKGTILHLDEVLTMSARMAAATGDPAWEKRYRNFEPMLNNAIAEMAHSAPPVVLEEVSKTDRANRELIALENKAFAAVRRGDKRTAQGVLSSVEYGTLKEIYADGMSRALKRLRFKNDADFEGHRTALRTCLIISMVLFSLLFPMWIFVVRLFQSRLREKHMEQEQMIRMLFSAIEQTPLSVVITDTKGTIEYVNPAFESVTGYSRGESVGNNPRMLKSGKHSPEFYKSMWERVLSDKQWKGEICNKKKNGELYWENCVISAIRDSEGDPTNFVAVKEDITRKMKVETTRLNAYRLESLGGLAGGIAHDFNNFLTVIMGNLSLTKDFNGDPGELNEIIEDALQASRSAQGLAAQLLTFAKGGAPVKADFALEPVLRDTVELACRGSNARKDIDITETLPLIHGDKGQIAEAIRGLTLNALEAMPEGGTVTVRAQSGRVEESSDTPLPSGTYVRVSVADTGCGISGDLIEKIFDPYFSTKTKGRGLGLSTCRSILLRHDGHISVSSRPGVGTSVVIYLPVASSSEVPPEETPARTGTPARRILIMDDDHMIVKVLTRMLRGLGCESDSVSDGDRAITAYMKAKEAGKPYAAVIMDLTIPGGMGGKEAIAKLKLLDPEVRAVVSSGYSDDDVMAHSAEYGFTGSISKPYDRDEVAKVIRQVAGLH